MPLGAVDAKAQGTTEAPLPQAKSSPAGTSSSPKDKLTTAVGLASSTQATTADLTVAAISPIFQSSSRPTTTDDLVTDVITITSTTRSSISVPSSNRSTAITHTGPEGAVRNVLVVTSYVRFEHHLYPTN